MNQSADAQPTTTLREILTHFFRDRTRILGVLFLGLALTLVAAILAPKRYTAEAALLLRLGREYVYTPEVGDGNTGSPVAYDREQTVQAEAKILTSRDVKEMALKKLGVAEVYPKIASSIPDAGQQQDAAVLAMERSLDAELLKGSNLLQVSFKHGDPEVAAKTLAGLVDAYLEKRLSVFSSATYGSAEADFVARTIQLNAAEAQLAAFKKDRGIRSFPEEQTLLLAQRNAIEQRAVESAFALAQAGGRAAALRSGLKGVSGEVTLSTETQRSDAIDATRKLLLDLQLKERDLSARYVDTFPAVQDIRADIARAQQYLGELESTPQRTVRTGRSPARDVAETELVRSVADESQAKAGASALDSQRTAIDKRLSQLAADEQQLRTLERERRLAEVNYEASAKRLRDEMVTEDLDRRRKSNVSLVQAPRPPLEANSLRPIILVVGTLLSLCAALLTAFLSALWRDTFLSPDQVERKLGLPTLASLPVAAR